MSTILDSFSRDANRVPIWTEGIISKKTITFAGATADAWGNDGGARDGGALFTVTGLVKAKVVGVCVTDCTGGGSTGEVGVALNTQAFIKTTTMTGVTAHLIWLNNTTPVYAFIVGGQTGATGNLPEWYLLDTSVILTTKTANTTGGVVDFYCVWSPISSDGSVTATTL